MNQSYHSRTGDDPPVPGWAQYLGREIRTNLENAFQTHQHTVQTSINALVTGMEDRLLLKLKGPPSMETADDEEDDTGDAKSPKPRRGGKKRTEEENNYHVSWRGLRYVPDNSC